MDIKIDYREDAVHKYFPQAKIENLAVGDILINDNFCIERKSAKDFLSSILNHHVFNQALNLNESYPHRCVIIVEGDLKSLSDTIFFSKIPNITINGVRKAIASLYVKYKVPVLLCSTRNGFVEMVNDIIEKSDGSGTELVFVEPPIKKFGANPKLQILLQVPKIGMKKAKKILEHYSLFSNIGKMEKPTGISDADIERIKEALK